MGLFSGLFRRSKPEAPKSGALGELSLLVGNLQGIGGRERQEDSFDIVNAAGVVERERRGLFAVVGGMLDGRQASEAAVAGLVEMFNALDGGVFRLNREYTCLNDLYLQELERETIDKQRAESDEEARALTSFVGIDRLERIEVSLRPLLLEKGDVILLCSDGVNGVLTGPELMEAMSLSPDEGCKLLETLVLEKQVLGQDNYTGILIACQFLWTAWAS